MSLFQSDHPVSRSKTGERLLGGEGGICNGGRAVSSYGDA
ncbi:hypothetical protein C7S15_5055 [Burkholderia cepacia]|nr:hypothetical protein [Burkholderia cepacia]